MHLIAAYNSCIIWIWYSLLCSIKLPTSCLLILAPSCSHLFISYNPSVSGRTWGMMRFDGLCAPSVWDRGLTTGGRDRNKDGRSVLDSATHPDRGGVCQGNMYASREGTGQQHWKWDRDTGWVCVLSPSSCLILVWSVAKCTKFIKHAVAA